MRKDVNKNFAPLFIYIFARYGYFIFIYFYLFLPLIQEGLFNID